MTLLKFRRNPLDDPKRLKVVGDIVRFWFDSGGGLHGPGFVIIWGRVVQAGPKTYSVVWENGNRNRVRQDNGNVTLEVDPELYDDAKKILARRLGP